VFDSAAFFQHVGIVPDSIMTESKELLKTERVYEALRHRIRSMQVQPGAPIRKDELAAEFGVSRAPVNDAIARLAEEGLIDVFPQHGSFVAQLRPVDVREGLFIRMAIEVEVIRRVTALRNAKLVSGLKHNLEAQEAALAIDDLTELYRLDEEMHDMLFAAVQFSKAEKILEAARAPLDRMRQIVMPNEGRPQATVREHRAIVEAVSSGDPEFAGAAMRMHLNSLLTAVEPQLEALEKI
jgi:GntR family transcriptional regulator, rspAB operon transcriptional repressor